MRYFTLLSLAVLFIISGCSEQGLNPETFTEPGFSGMILFTGTVPPADSVKDLRVVAVPYYPIDTAFQPLILKVIEGAIPFGENISSRAVAGTQFRYELMVKPQIYRYVAVVQQYGADVFSQWKVVGVYAMPGNDSIPLPVTVKDGVMTQNINMTVDFYHLPPQPFRVP